MSDCCPTEPDNPNPQQRRILITVLILNAAMFFIEFTAGWIADSSGLIADSLDMLADAAVYAISLYAVGRSFKHKAAAAMTNGGLQLALGLLVIADVIRRIFTGSDPAAGIMFSIAGLALLVNIACFWLLYRYRAGDINLKSSWICSRNDMLANAGVLLAAGLVAVLNTPWPDWLIGATVAGIVIHSALRIIREARQAWISGDAITPGCCRDE